MNHLNIVFLDALSLGELEDLQNLKEFGDVDYYDFTPPEKIVERVKKADVIITNKNKINQNVMDAAENLKLICISATGTDNVDLDYAEKKGIPVKNVTGYSSNSVAQFTFSALFYLLCHSDYYDEFVKSGKYSKHQLFTHIGPSFYELQGKIFGIIGLGNIGKKVAEIAKGFGCEIIYYSTSGKNLDALYTHHSLQSLLKTADVVSIHAPLYKKTKNLLDYPEIKMMKPSAYLLNMGRGGIINECGLARALDENLIAGAALDVLEKEPPANDNPLLHLQNPKKLYISPHIAWTSIESRKALMEGICNNIREFIKS